MESGALRDELDQHRDRAVRLRRGRGEEAVRHLALHHHAPQLQVGQAVEAFGDKRGRDVVRQVGDELRRTGRRLAKVEPQRVAEPELDVRAAGDTLHQLRTERRIELDGVDLLDAVGEKGGQDAQTGADLEHDVALVQLGLPPDHAEDVLVDEKVLPELLLGPNGHARPRAARALSSMRCASSPGSSPRVSASDATVWTTYAGSFLLPRTGCGAR